MGYQITRQFYCFVAVLLVVYYIKGTNQIAHVFPIIYKTTLRHNKQIKHLIVANHSKGNETINWK